MGKRFFAIRYNPRTLIESVVRHLCPYKRVHILSTFDTMQQDFTFNLKSYEILSSK